MGQENQQNFLLFETVLWSSTHGFAYLAWHLQRLTHSAHYFHVPVQRQAALAALYACEKPSAPYAKVKLVCDAAGRCSATAAPFTPPPPETHWRVCLSPHRTDPGDVFLYHKTTHRALYDDEFSRIQALGFDEVLFLNTRNELSEASRSTLFWQEDGQWFTPPLSSGLLPGIRRRRLIQEGAREQAIGLEGLRQAQAVYLGNALRGLVKVMAMITPAEET